MYEEMNQNISRLIDGDLGYHDTLVLLKKIQSDEVLMAKMCRYQAISEALKTDEFFQVNPNFSQKIFQEIQREPTYLLPQLKPHHPSQQQNSKLRRNKMLAIAASTVAVAVFVGQNLRNEPSVNKYQTVAAVSIPTQPFATSLNKQEKLKQTDRQPLNTQFNEYLQAHNSSVYTNGEANFQPYAKVTSYGQR
jgi:sigma-E factor negative regulatory protein RseA